MHQQAPVYDQSQFNSPMSQQSNIHSVVPIKSFPNNHQPVRSSAQVFPFIQNNSESVTNLVEPMVSSNSVSPTFKSDDMPSLTPYPGQFDFNIYVPNGEYDETKRKGQTCVYQVTEEGTHQLFTKPSPHYWRLNYSVDSSFMQQVNNGNSRNTFIRLVPVYGDPEKAQCVLERCPRHKEASAAAANTAVNALTNDSQISECHGVLNGGHHIRQIPNSQDALWRQRSMVLVEKSTARYMQDSISKRVCVLLPWEPPSEGQTHASVNCQFVCYNSCFNQDSGGRKTLFLIITLERMDDSGNKNRPEVLGRQCLQFRSCACPSRDWRDKKVGGSSGGRGKRGGGSGSGNNNNTGSKDDVLNGSISNALLLGGGGVGSGGNGSGNCDSNGVNNLFKSNEAGSNSTMTLGNCSSVPINMGGKDAIIRVIPSLPGLDEAVNSLVWGYLCKKTMETNGINLLPIIDAFRQCKDIEERIIEKLTTTYDPTNDPHSPSVSSSSSQISPINTSTSSVPATISQQHQQPQPQLTAAVYTNSDYNNTFIPETVYASYTSTVRSHFPTIIPNYSMPAQFSVKAYQNFPNSYDDLKLLSDTRTPYEYENQ